MGTVNEYKWLEFAAICNGKWIRNHFFRIDDSDAIKKWRMRFNNRDIFTSVCVFAEPKRDCAFVTRIMFFDIDAPDNLEKGRADTLGFCQMLEEKAKIPRDSIGVFYSGSKGFHIEVPCEVFCLQPSKYVLELCKRMANKVVEAGLTSLDTGIYTPARLWRLTGSINGKKNLYKIPMTYEELRDIGLDEIVNHARTSCGDESYALSSFCQAAADWYQKAVSVLEKESNLPPIHRQMNLDFKQGWRMSPCVKAIEEATLADGSRHSLYVHLSRYYAYLNMHPEEIRERILKIDARNPIRDPDSIDRAIDWGCRNPGFTGCRSTVFSNYCKKEECFYAKLKEI